MKTAFEVAGICVAVLLVIFGGYHFFGKEPNPLDSSDLQARREFERSQAREAKNADQNKKAKD
jgi:hypothetical protein